MLTKLNSVDGEYHVSSSIDMWNKVTIILGKNYVPEFRLRLNKAQLAVLIVQLNSIKEQLHD